MAEIKPFNRNFGENVENFSLTVEQEGQEEKIRGKKGKLEH